MAKAKIENYVSSKKDEVVKLNKEKKQFDYANGEIILSVKHLKQFFRFGRGEYKYTKAVHDVSFDVYKGEVFGLVGESGCGKTTTGRSIIKLYKITSGDVWFKGVRIAAGTRWNEKEIKFTNIRLKAALKQLKEQEKNEIEQAKGDEEAIANIKAKFQALREEKIEAANTICTTQRAKIKQAHHDNDYCDADIAKARVKEVKEKYADLLDEEGKVKIKNAKAEFALKKKDLDAVSPETKIILERYKEYSKELEEAKHASITRSMQMIFQDPIASLNPRMTIRNIIAEGLIIKGVKDQDFITKEVNRVLELVGLVPEHANRYPHEFSGGQRQRIGIARAIIMNPELIIADEPVSALDVSIQAQVINLLNDLRENLGLTILFIAHNLSVVKYFCDRIAVMYYGSLMEVATSEELFKHPLHPYTKSLLSAVPHPDPNTEQGRTRIVYHPELEHDYSTQKPTLRELAPGHFVRCNDEEAARYLEELKK
ncbi:MAG: ATP-binding cassette domain-containing protein [Bacilli bacterium]|mgnify:CR=1 FL=1|nr:ATP-binding cassette domain-containing protein [Bacilli bacterium]